MVKEWISSESSSRSIVRPPFSAAESQGDSLVPAGAALERPAQHGVPGAQTPLSDRANGGVGQFIRLPVAGGEIFHPRAGDGIVVGEGAVIGQAGDGLQFPLSEL